MSERDLPEPARLQSLVEGILHAAARGGASAAEAAVSASTALSLTVRMGEVETVEHHRERSLAVTVYNGTRKGTASTADWSPTAVADTVAAAWEIACHTAEDPCTGLADPDLLAREFPELDLDHPWDLDPDAATDIARRTEDAARTADRRIANSEGASISTRRSRSAYGNSNGFLAASTRTRHGLSCTVLARDESGMQRDGWYTADRHPQRLQEPDAVGTEAARRALARLGSRPVPTSEVPVLFVPEQARGLIGHFLAAIRGGSLYRRASFLLDRLDTPVFPSGLHIREEPHIPGALASAAWDAEGVATRPRDLVSDGVLRGYLLDSYSARRLGLRSTGNAGGIHNVVVTPGEPDFEELVRRLGRGLVVTHLMGQGVNTLTGDYSRGAAGFWVEGGEIAHAVEEVTIAGNLKEMFAGILELGSDVDSRGAVRCGSLLLGSMTVAGRSSTSSG